MPNIDTSAIEGFDAMSADEKVSALLGLDIPEAVDLSQYVSKSVFDKKASEAAELSKRLRAKQTDDEAAASEREAQERKNAEDMEDLRKQIETLQKEKTVATYKAAYISQGYEERLAEETAQALADGKMDKVFQNAGAFKTELEKKLRAEIMGKNPHPDGGRSDGGKTTIEEQAQRIGKARAEANKKATEGVQAFFAK